MKIIIGADIVPTQSNMEYFEKARMQEIISDNLLSVLNSVDYKIMNLEVPLTNIESPIKKCGPNLIASTKSVNGIKQLEIDLLTISNNHILDQNEQGLFSTIKVLDENNINFVGAGKTISEAKKPFIFEIANKKIGVYACAENEFTIAEEDKAGANPFDALESLDHIENVKNQCDFVIVLYHGGKEHYRYPSPNLQRVCRKIVDKGADLVVCQHSHCIGCEEKYQNETIVYGQGNFLFDHSDSEFWQTSLLIQITIENNIFNIEYIPVVKDDNGVKLANKSESDIILSEFKKRSSEIIKDNFVKEQYSLFSQEYLNNYLRSGVPFGFSLLSKIANKIFRSHLYIMLLGKQSKLSIYNYLNCEAHRELYLEGLKRYLNKGE